MTPEIRELLDKAHDCLTRARIILAAGVGEDAGRDAYLAVFHAAPAVIRARIGKTAGTHRGVHRLSRMGRDDPELAGPALFLSQNLQPESLRRLRAWAGCGRPA